MPLYLTRIEGPPPKRNVVRSSRARGAIRSGIEVVITGLTRNRPGHLAMTPAVPWVCGTSTLSHSAISTVFLRFSIFFYARLSTGHWTAKR